MKSGGGQIPVPHNSNPHIGFRGEDDNMHLHHDFRIVCLVSLPVYVSTSDCLKTFVVSDGLDNGVR